MYSVKAVVTENGSTPAFETTSVGDRVPARAYEPVTIIDAVRWAGFQENYAPLHYDRDYARKDAGLESFIASGAYRESLLVRLLTDWVGPRGRLRKLQTRQAYPTFEGDSLRYSGRVVEKSTDAADPWVICEMGGVNQHDRQVLQARCTLELDNGSGNER